VRFGVRDQAIRVRVGALAIDSAQSHDIPVIQGVLLVTIAVVLVSNLIVDALLGWLRPGVKRS